MNYLPLVVGAALVLAVATLGGVVAADAPAQLNDSDTADSDTAETTTTDEANASEMEPGAQMAGVVGTQRAEYDSDLDSRSDGLRIARAASDEARADIVAERFDEVEARLADHEQQHATLQQAREAGAISEATYRGRVARLAAEQARTERAADQLNTTARGLPAALLAERNINVSAIEQLRTDARMLGGPETAAIARSIGSDVRNPMAGNVTRGPAGTPAEERPGGDRGPRGPAGGDAGDRSGSGERGGAGDRGGTDERGSGSGAGERGGSGSGAGSGGSGTSGSSAGSGGTGSGGSGAGGGNSVAGGH